MKSKVDAAVEHTKAETHEARAYKLADETLTWSYLVSNIGTIPISGITVGDDQGVTVNCPGAALNADTAMTCTGTDILGAGLYGIAP